MALVITIHSYIVLVGALVLAMAMVGAILIIMTVGILLIMDITHIGVDTMVDIGDATMEEGIIMNIIQIMEEAMDNFTMAIRRVGNITAII